MSEAAEDRSAGSHPTAVAAARGGDAAAWEKLVRVHSPTIFRWCQRAGLRSADAADIVQETWSSVVRALPRFDHGQPGATFRGWLYTIVRNKLRDRHRHADPADEAEGGSAARQRLEELPEQESAESRSDVGGGVDATVRRAMDELRGEFEPRTFTMFWETTVAGRSAREVAAEHSVSPDAVYQAKSRVGRRLRALLGDAA